VIVVLATYCAQASTIIPQPLGVSLLTECAEEHRLLTEIGNDLCRTLEVGRLLLKIADTLFAVFRQADRCFLIVAEGDKNERLWRFWATASPPTTSPRPARSR
jgi:hypothetical protein